MDRFAMTNMGEVSLIIGTTVTSNHEEGTLIIMKTYYVQKIP